MSGVGRASCSSAPWPVDLTATADERWVSHHTPKHFGGFEAGSTEGRMKGSGGAFQGEKAMRAMLEWPSALRSRRSFSRDEVKPGGPCPSGPSACPQIVVLAAQHPEPAGDGENRGHRRDQHDVG